MKSGRFMQSIMPVPCAPSSFIAANEDIFNGDPATDVINMEGYEKITFFIIKNAGATGTADITVESCDDTTPSNTTAIAFKYWEMTSIDTWSDMKAATTSGFTTTAGADQMYAVEVSADALDSTDQYVRMKMTENVNNPVDGAVMCILSNPRYEHEVPDSVIV